MEEEIADLLLTCLPDDEMLVARTQREFHQAEDVLADCQAVRLDNSLEVVQDELPALLLLEQHCAPE